MCIYKEDIMGRINFTYFDEDTDDFCEDGVLKKLVILSI